VSAIRGLANAVRTGNRVFLRLPTASDKAQCCALRKRSAKRLRQWEPRPPKGVDRSDAGWFARLVAYRRSIRSRKLLVCLRADGAIIGGASLNEIVRGAMQGGFAGWWIGDPYEGQGYMHEALGLLLEHAFLDLRLHRVEANIRPENVRSKRLAESVGMRREGYSPKYLQIAGDWCDHERWAVLADEWQVRRRASMREARRSRGLALPRSARRSRGE